MIPDYLQQLQDDIWGILTNDPGFEFVPVYRSRTPLEKDDAGEPIVGQSAMIEEQIEQTLAGLAFKDGKCGIVAIVMLPDVRPESIESRGPALEFAPIIRIIEDRLFNEGTTGTGISASRLALHTIQVLHRRSIAGSNTLAVDGDKMFAEISLPDDRKAIEVRLKVTQSSGLLLKVDRPVIAVAADILTLTCPTADAAIWWTTDGTWPGPANPTANLYDQPVQITGITAIRAAAYLPIRQPSDDQSWAA